MSEVQAILFVKDGKYNTPAKQKRWMRDNGFKLLEGKEVHETEKYWRYRVAEPDPNMRKRIERFSENVHAIIQFPKGRKMETSKSALEKEIKTLSDVDKLHSELHKKREEAIIKMREEAAKRKKLEKDTRVAELIKAYEDVVEQCEAKKKTVVDSMGRVVEERFDEPKVIPAGKKKAKTTKQEREEAIKLLYKLDKLESVLHRKRDATLLQMKKEAEEKKKILTNRQIANIVKQYHTALDELQSFKQKISEGLDLASLRGRGSDEEKRQIAKEAAEPHKPKKEEPKPKSKAMEAMRKK